MKPSEWYADSPWPNWSDLQRWMNFWSPSVSLPFGLTPLATLSALFTLIVTTGMLVGSLAALVTSLLILYLLLTQVFGLRFELGLS